MTQHLLCAQIQCERLMRCFQAHFSGQSAATLSVGQAGREVLYAEQMRVTLSALEQHLCSATPMHNVTLTRRLLPAACARRVRIRAIVLSTTVDFCSSNSRSSASGPQRKSTLVRGCCDLSSFAFIASRSRYCCNLAGFGTHSLPQFSFAQQTRLDAGKLVILQRANAASVTV